MIRHFTGFHMLGFSVAFFGIIVAVNITMAMLATRTFGGTVVDNSYVASQKFNGWLAEARAERALDWRLSAEREGHFAIIHLDGADGAQVKATAIHPLGRLPDKTLHFIRLSSHRYRSIELLPAGRWRLEIEVRQGRRGAHFVDEVPA